MNTDLHSYKLKTLRRSASHSILKKMSNHVHDEPQEIAGQNETSSNPLMKKQKQK